MVSAKHLFLCKEMKYFVHSSTCTFEQYADCRAYDANPPFHVKQIYFSKRKNREFFQEYIFPKNIGFLFLQKRLLTKTPRKIALQ